MGTTCKVEKGREFYHFKTQENVLRCPICNHEYKKRKKCLSCYREGRTIETEVHVKEHLGKIQLNLQGGSCSCIFSSFFKHSTHWKKNKPLSRCRHIKLCLKYIERGKLEGE